LVKIRIPFLKGDKVLCLEGEEAQLYVDDLLLQGFFFVSNGRVLSAKEVADINQFEKVDAFGLIGGG